MVFLYCLFLGGINLIRKKDSFTQLEIDDMVKYHNAGYLNKDIAELYHTSKTMVARIFQELGLPSRHPRLTDERKEMIKNYYLSCYNKTKTCEAMNCGTDTLNKIIKEYNLYEPSSSELKRKYSIDEDYFDEINTPEKAYALGLYYSDGTVHKKNNSFSISLQECDKAILDKLNNNFGGNRKLTYIELNKKNANWSNQYMFTVTSEKMRNDLIKHGCVPNKSLILKFPTTIPKHLLRDFVRGYFDGDGSISKTEDRCTLVSTNDFCKKLSDIVKNELNVNSSIFFCHGNENTTTRTFQIAGKYQVKKFLDWLYFDSELHLDRKYQLYLSKYNHELLNNSLSA